MSAQIKCDGPGCGEIKFPNADPPASGWVALKFWIHILQDDQGFDFHNRDCLAAWVAENPG